MIFYDWILSLGFLLFLPKIVFRKRLPTLKQRFGWELPPGKDVIWIHAVSVGEVKSAQGLLAKLREKHPNDYILITVCTATGMEEAKRSLSQANGFYFLPVDISFIMKKWVKQLKPKLLIFVETDLWYNLLRFAKRYGAKIVLVSGKISERSASRYKKVPFFANKIFSNLDLILAQNEEHRKRFESWSSNLHIGGNLKLDASANFVNKDIWAPYFSGTNLLITCTHDPEEDELLSTLHSVPGTIYLAPRHPERFPIVADLLKSKKIPYILWSQIESRTGAERVVLIDSMGLLPIFYSFCNLTIVAGSFSSRVGGHNILEPCLYGSPVFFGPAMHQQTELTKRVLEARAGIQSTTTDLPKDILSHLKNPEPLRTGAITVTQRWEYLR
jgi:3-deoxy-D-manno-octulosonic-acid transferase